MSTAAPSLQLDFYHLFVFVPIAAAEAASAEEQEEERANPPLDFYLN
jgi:hypothetical protein